MPAIVIGADTEIGLAILEGLFEPNREVRAFVTDEDVGLRLKEQGFKVAIGDVSDESHVEAAAMRCFTAVLVTDAAEDERERSFLDSPRAVMEGWAAAVSSSQVTRTIWVTTEEPPDTSTKEVAVVDPTEAEFVGKVVELDDAQVIT